MDGSTHFFRDRESAFQPFAGSADSVGAPTAIPDRAPPRQRFERIGLIANPRSRRNAGRVSTWSHPNVIVRAPATRDELRSVLADFAVRGIDLLVIDGGDGTVRDVLTCAGDAWRAGWPDILLLPTGKTNALASDIGLASQWTLEAGLDAAARGRRAIRRPLEIGAGTGDALRGFVMGAGVFVDATELAQRTHRAGLFNNIAVALTLVWGIACTLFGGARSAWRRGSPIGVSYGARATRFHGARPDGLRDRYLMFASTLDRLPAGLKPFGTPRSGLKTLVVDAPPRYAGVLIPLLIAGWRSAVLEREGYHRVDAERLRVELPGGFVLDGERFAGGSYQLSEAAALRFVIP